MKQVELQEAQRDLQRLIDAALRGEMVFILGEGDQAVQLIPVERERKPRKAGSARGLITIADDFDAPLPDFDEYQR